MNPIHKSVLDYFRYHQCEIKQLEDMYEVQLTRYIDEHLLNRSFYWKYMDAMKQTGQAEKLNFHFTNNKKDGHFLDRGHPIFHKILEHLQSKAQFYLGYEKISTDKQTMLHPYLIVNYLLRLEGKQVQEEIHSFGLNLITGKQTNQWMEVIKHIRMDETISPYCYTMTPLIYLKSGYQRIEQKLNQYLEQLTHNWAVEAYEEMQAYIAEANQWIDAEAKRSKYITEMKKVLYPTISISIINAGMLHLRPDTIK